MLAAVTLHRNLISNWQLSTEQISVELVPESPKH
jgi:hypothetical protein